MADFSWRVSYGDIKKDLISRFSKTHPGVTLGFDHDLAVETAYSDDKSVVIGDTGCSLSDDYFSVIRSIFHEFRHVDQRRSNFACCGKYASECRIEDIACQGSRLYYGAGLRPVRNAYTGETELRYFREPWYFHNVREVDAEKHGVFDAYRFLLSNPSYYDGNLRDAYLEHINGHVHAPGEKLQYFIDFDKSFKSFEDVEKCFDAALDDAVVYRRYDSVLKTGYSPFKDDSVVGMVMRLSDIGWCNAASRFVWAETGVEERRIMAGVTRAVHPEYTQNLPHDDRKAISTWNTFRTLSLPAIPDDIKDKYDILPDSKRKTYYLDAVDRLSRFDGPDAGSGFDTKIVPDGPENFP